MDQVAKPCSHLKTGLLITSAVQCTDALLKGLPASTAQSQSAPAPGRGGKHCSLALFCGQSRTHPLWLSESLLLFLLDQRVNKSPSKSEPVYRLLLPFEAECWRPGPSCGGTLTPALSQPLPRAVPSVASTGRSCVPAGRPCGKCACCVCSI